jgi:putative FmdB family regulatory protein
MPFYDYGCLDCGHDFSVFLTLQEFDSLPKIVCPQCGSDNVRRKITGFVAMTSRKS